jgi:SRSO17 transposase
MVAGTRIRVEEYFEDGKVHLGMADYEARAWTSWHHHMARVAHDSHRKTWLQKHKQLARKLLL